MIMIILKVTIVVLILIKKVMHLVFVAKCFLLVQKVCQLICIYFNFFFLLLSSLLIAPLIHFIPGITHFSFWKSRLLLIYGIPFI